MNRQSRPVYLNLLEFRFPATAITSLLHRISGVLLFLALPLLIYGLEHSLQGGEGMVQLQQLGQWLPVRLAVAVMAWALFHHWLAGWRFLFIDVDAGVEITRARLTARLLNGVSLTGLVMFVGISL
jgi:succinate dehydrogenase / fumarate reductase cytochrome b subunit